MQLVKLRHSQEFGFGGVGFATTSTAVVTIDVPAATDGQGSFTFNEIVAGSLSGATARVKTYNSK